MKKSRLIIMDIIIVILVVLNAAMIIAVAENYNDENRTYNTRWFMNLYKNDEYGRAVDYASRDKIVIDNIQDNELDESMQSIIMRNFIKMYIRQWEIRRS